MNVLIVGLGLMGGAYAQKLTNKGYTVYGSDINENAIKFAKLNNYIAEGSTNPRDYIAKSDIIVLCFYPTLILDFLKNNKDLFNDKQIITDICGVKESFVFEAYELAKPANYCSHHPMAGREKVGVEYSHLCDFEKANFLITPSGDIEEYVIWVLKKMASDMGFARVTVLDPVRHDNMIGFTSQLTHAIAVSLVNSDHDSDTKNFIGDSYRDLTRIAMINENLWSELFLENKDYLLDHIKSFEVELDRLKDALNNGDREELNKIFKSSTAIRKNMEK